MSGASKGSAGGKRRSANFEVRRKFRRQRGVCSTRKREHL